MNFCTTLKVFELNIQGKPNKNSSTASDNPNIKPKSTWKHGQNHLIINTFLEPRNNDVNELFQHKQTLQSNNTSQLEKNIIRELSKQEDLVSTNVDNAGATLILDVGDYTEKANKESKDKNYYKKPAMIQRRPI